MHMPQAWAQDRDALPQLEDLIPDAALEDPENWAQNQAPDPQEPDLQEPLSPIDDDPDGGAIEPDLPDFADGELAPNSPLAEMPDFAIDWPVGDDLPQLTPLDRDEDVEFAEADRPVSPILPDAQIARLDDTLILAFPVDADGFPERTEFLERFEALSTIEQLDGDDETAQLLAARARRDEELLGTLLRIYGYYDAQVIRTINRRAIRRRKRWSGSTYCPAPSTGSARSIWGNCPPRPMRRHCAGRSTSRSAIRCRATRSWRNRSISIRLWARRDMPSLKSANPNC